MEQISFAMRKKNYDVLLHGFLNVTLIILARYIFEVCTSDLVSSAWFMDAGCHDSWVYKETNARGGGWGSGWVMRCAYESSFYV